MKLVWHRKRANALITIEIFASFLIVFIVATLGISLWSRWDAPLGFDWHDVWVMSVFSSSGNREISATHMSAEVAESERKQSRTAAENVRRLQDELRAFPEVETTGVSATPPYLHHDWETVIEREGRRVVVSADNVDDNFANAMRLHVVNGRWFTDDDETQNYQAIVLDTDAAVALFGSQDPIGQTIPGNRFSDEPDAPKDLKVVGVIQPYRRDGEFTATRLNMVFLRVSRRFASQPEATQVLIRVKPGTPASFEAELNDRLRLTDSGVRYRVRKMEDMRQGAIRMALTPIIALAIVGLFLVSMVALGLTGVLWQTVTRRTREIGLRRAVGASGAGVRAQVLGEVAVLVTFAVIAGIVVVLQLPLLGVFRVASPADFAWGIASALAAIYAITLLCGAYPSWLASTIQPAEALHYE